MTLSGGEGVGPVLNRSGIRSDYWSQECYFSFSRFVDNGASSPLLQLESEKTVSGAESKVLLLPSHTVKRLLKTIFY